MNSPQISVILPVYNAAPFLDQALQSLFAQTFSDFEILAIDDGSTDGSAEILRQAAGIDPRLRVLSRENRGLVSTLNQTIAHARAPFLARMDADDISLPARFAQQIAFLGEHPSIAVVGSWVKTFGNESRVWQYPTDPAELLCTLVFRCPLAHPSVMLRRSLFTHDGFTYDAGARHAEDYALWIAVAQKHSLANLPEVLLHYRTHDSQVTSLNTQTQRQTATKLQLQFIAQRFQIAAAPAEAGLHRALAFSEWPDDPTFPAAATDWLRKLAAANEAHHAFPSPAFSHILTGRFVSLAKFARAHRLPIPHVTSTPFAPFIHPAVLPDIR